MSIYSTIVFLHILAGVFFASNLIVMQIVVTGIMKGLPPGEIKKKADSFLEKNWRPVMSAIILLIWFTAAILLHFNWQMILISAVYQFKTATGLLTLVVVSINHFFLRHWKRKLNKSEPDQPRTIAIKKISYYLEKIALVGASATVILGVFGRHFY